MNLDELRNFRDANPFQPFEIILVDGRTFKVPHRDFILIPPGRQTWVYVAHPKSGVVDHINTLIISSIRPYKPRPTRRRKAS